MNIDQLIQEHSIFKIGEVSAVDGREVVVKVDSSKNMSHIIYKGGLIKNVSVGGYLKVLKGFLFIIGKVEKEYVKENNISEKDYSNPKEEYSRFLVLKVIGYIENNEYFKGVKELPIIGNECLLMSNDEFGQIHSLSSKNEVSINLGHLLMDESVPISLSINKLFASHVGIFGNTGSGKSYTLASIYKKMFDRYSDSGNFKKNAKFVLFDFNGEYSSDKTITLNKKVYNLSTRKQAGEDKIPLSSEDILNPELVYILANATEKTQQPFIKRALNLYKTSHGSGIRDSISYTKSILRQFINETLLSSGAVLVDVLSALKGVLSNFGERDENGVIKALDENLRWNATYKRFIN